MSKYIGVCMDCGKTVDNLNEDGECSACVEMQIKERDKRFNGWCGLQFVENERPACCQG